MSDTLGAWALDTAHGADALTLLRGLPDDCIDLIATDPPFYGVKDEAWDNQWDTLNAFLAWLDTHLIEFRRVLKPNGSLYLFCATKYASKVEAVVERHFAVLNNIRWRKPPYSTKAEMFDKDTMRAYFPASESIIFAEQYGSDKPYSEALIDGNSTYWQACETAKVSVFGDYLLSEFNRAGVSRKEVAALFPSRTGGLTGCVSNWLLGLNVPTNEQYERMRAHLNQRGDEYLKQNYEDLRKQYEDMRRPFFATADVPYTDVWDFATVNTYPGKHPCEKPLDMMRHIVRISSRAGDIVLDCFCGSGVTLKAAWRLGRRYLGCDNDPYWARRAHWNAQLPYNLELFSFEAVGNGD